jgi:hypothetical protein
VADDEEIRSSREKPRLFRVSRTIDAQHAVAFVPAWEAADAHQWSLPSGFDRHHGAPIPPTLPRLTELGYNRRMQTIWNLLKLVAGVNFILAGCCIGLFIATLAGVYKTSYEPWQFLNAEPRIWVGCQLVLHAAFWLAAYYFCDARLKAALKKLNSLPRSR